MNNSYFGQFAGVYDAFTENAEYAERADYILSILKNNGINSGILLDLACGTGTLTKLYAKAGYDVIGVDISEEMLCIARNKILPEYPQTLILCQDMCELDLYGTINACVCSLDSLNHLTDAADIKKVFERVSLFTEPGGLFIFDVNTLYKHRYVLADNSFVYENDLSFLVWQNELCDDGETVDIYIDIFEDDGKGKYLRSSEEFSERAYSTEMLKSMLIASGFSEIEIFGDMKFEEPDETEERIYFIAKKG